MNRPRSRNRCVTAALLVILTSSPLAAQSGAPDSLSFQGFLTDSSGTPLNTASIAMVFKLYKSSVAVWSETHPTVAVVDGLFNVVLGGTTALDTLAFNEPIEIGITVGTDAELSPRTPLTSAAYAKALPGLYTYSAKDPVTGDVSENVVGGHRDNYVGADVVGATISGGGGFLGQVIGGGDIQNAVTGNWGSVGGGIRNEAGLSGTVGGGAGNQASGSRAAVAGGSQNSATASWAAALSGFQNQASGEKSVIGGGEVNRASGETSVIGGGERNRASGENSVVPGGLANAARGSGSFAAGYRAKSNHDGAFVWKDFNASDGNDTLSSTAINQFIVEASGGVGFGTNRPKDTGVTVSRASADSAYQIELRNVGNLTTPFFDGIAFTQGAFGETRLGSIKLAYRNNGRPDMRFSVRDADDALSIESASGDVGIGTTSPSDNLEVNGGITAVTVTETSDRRFKRNVRPLEGALAKLTQLQGVSFEWDSEQSPGRDFEAGQQIGFIAQDVDRVVPEVVRVGDDDFYSMSYAKLVPLLVEAIKEQEREIQRLRTLVEGQP